jgi:hypothetical protein
MEVLDPDFMKNAVNNIYYKLYILYTYAEHLLYIQNFFTDNIFGTVHDFIIYFREFFRYDYQNICILIRGNNVFIYLAVWKIAIIIKIEIEIINKWFLNHFKKHFIQKRNYTKKEKRPNYEIKNHYIFRNSSDYLISHDFEAISEYKYQQKIISKIKKYILNIRIIQIPGAGDRRFMIFISISDEFLFRAKPKDTVNINFVSDVDNCDDD